MDDNLNQVSGRHLFNRRGFLGHMATGISGVALAQILAREGLLAESRVRGGVSDIEPIRPAIDASNPHAARLSHFASRAKNVVVIMLT